MGEALASFALGGLLTAFLGRRVSAAVPVGVLPLGLLLGREARLRPVAVAGVVLVGVGVVALVLG